MRTVILRDDDTNALTPVDCLERLYRPFLDRGLPVNLATIPRVRTDARRLDGKVEGFLLVLDGFHASHAPLEPDSDIACYLRAEPGFRIVQHGFEHSLFEFETRDRAVVRNWIRNGAECLAQAGFARPEAFVAPYDRFSRTSLAEVARHFRVVSTGWFELGRLPVAWWPRYVLKKATKRPHWKIGRTWMLSHPGCLLSCHRPRNTMLAEVKRAVLSSDLTILVTHWWEYFRDSQPDTAFIAILHQVADWLATDPSVRVIGFEDLVKAADGERRTQISPDREAWAVR